MQELSYESLALEKVWGTPVDFSQGREIGLQMYTFRDDVFGISAYQGVPVTVDAIVHDAFVNGNLADLVNQASGQGMAIQYVRISWNETVQGSKYYITDLVVGVVVKVTRDWNTGSAYLIDALKAVGWYNQLISKMYMPWKSWLLLMPTRSTAYKTCQDTMISDTKYVSAPIGTPLPDLPSAEEVKAQLLQEGNFDDALGHFAMELLDKGYTVTILEYRVEVCFEKTPTFRQPAGYFWGYQYKLHVRFSWDFISDPDFTVESATQATLSLTVAMILAICIGIAIIIGVSIISWNFSRTESGYIEWEVLRDAQGNPIFDKNGNPIIVPKKQGWQSGPPDWWSYVIPIAVIGVAVVGAVLVIPQIISAKPERERIVYAPPPPP